MANRIKVAVIGSGLIGPIHVEALSRIGVEVKGILDITLERARRAAEAMKLELAYASLDQVLADRDVACVHIAAPNRLHYEFARRILEAGKHVICEKPLAMTSRESAELVRLSAKRPNQVAAVNYNIRFYPVNLEARSRMRAGELGEVFHVRGSYIQDWLLFPDDYNWRVLAKEGGETRAVGDIGTHWLDLVHFITGLEIEAVMADLKTVHPIRRRPAGEVETFKDKEGKGSARRVPIRITTEDYGTVLLRFRGGARGTFTVSQVTAGRKNCLSYEMACSKRAIAWVSETPNELWIGKREGANEVLLRDPSLTGKEARAFISYPGGHNEGFPDTFKQLYRAIYADIAAGRPSPKPLYATFRDGHRELLLCEAIVASSRKRAWVGVRKP